MESRREQSDPGSRADPPFVVVCAHFYPELNLELRRQYELFRAQFLSRGIPLRTLAIGAHYESWRAKFPELRLVEGDLLFQKERLWTLGARLAEQEGFDRFLCLDGDLVFDGENWESRLDAAFRGFDVFQPFRRVVHLFDERRVERRTPLRFPLRLSSQQTDVWRAHFHRAYRHHLERVLKTKHAFGFGVGFNARFLNSVGLYEFAIVGGGDRILWNALTWLLHPPTAEARRYAVEVFLTQPGLPESEAFRDSLSDWIEEGRSKLDSLRIGYAARVTAVPLPRGKHASRRYRDRNSILSNFDPERDLKATPGQGLMFAEDAAQLGQAVAGYMRARLA